MSLTEQEQRIDKLEDVVTDLVYRIKQLEPSEYGECNECGRELDEEGFCSYPCPNCDQVK